jgi:hypothetical protein
LSVLALNFWKRSSLLLEEVSSTIFSIAAKIWVHPLLTVLIRK